MKSKKIAAKTLTLSKEFEFAAKFWTFYQFTLLFYLRFRRRHEIDTY